MKSLKSSIDSKRGKNIDILLLSEEVNSNNKAIVFEFSQEPTSRRMLCLRHGIFTD